MPLARRARLTGTLALAALGAYPLVVGWQTAETVMHPPPFPHPDDPARYGLAPKDVAIASPNARSPLKGWLFERPDAAGRAVLVLHGWRSHRRHMLGGYLAWLARRYTVLAFDHPGHGESPPGVTTLGAREREDARAAFLWLRARGHDRVAVFGVSMGGAAAIGLAAHEPRIRAVVSEGAFARPGVATVLPLHDAGYWPARFLGWTAAGLVGLRAGVDIHASAAERQIGRIAPRPVLLIHGTADGVIAPDSAKRLFAAAGAPKRLWLVPGADHASDARHGPHPLAAEEYERRVFSFLDAAL